VEFADMMVMSEGMTSCDELKLDVTNKIKELGKLLVSCCDWL
jgi:hypothetical protein